MKTIIFSFIFIFYTSLLFGQVTLQNTNNPIPGDVDSYAICDTTNISQGNSGANQTWNFTNLTRNDSTSVTFVASSTTPFSAEFPSSNIASTNDNSNYSYLTSSSTNLVVNGYAGPNGVIAYSDAQLYMQYPFTYNTTFNDNFASNYTIGGIATVRTGTTTVSGDAWGTINLPDGSFTNALRVKYVITTRDSSNPGIPVVSISDLTSYNWFVPGRKFPVFEIIYVTFSFNGMILNASKVVNYNDNSTSGISNITNEIPDKYNLSQNYPNPFNPTTKFRFAIPKSGLVKLTIFNSMGKEVETLVNGQMQNGTYEVDWNAGNNSSGVYFYKLQTSEFVETRKMTLVK